MRQVPDGPTDLYCPLWRKPMSKVCKTCPWWAQVSGKDGQGRDVHHWDCAIAHSTMLSIEKIGAVRGVQASVEVQTNTVADVQKQAAVTLAAAISPPRMLSIEDQGTHGDR